MNFPAQRKILSPARGQITKYKYLVPLAYFLSPPGSGDSRLTNQTITYHTLTYHSIGSRSSVSVSAGCNADAVADADAEADGADD